MELISESPKIKVGHVTGIMKLVEKLKETQVDSTFSSVEVVTAQNF
ncbi:3012_t:CDS:2 [Rhizophagus irregularis]|nr:3012_t:CDS:2 [Rhizophagus irregularis]